MSAVPDWVWLASALVLLVGGGALMLFALRGDRAKGRERCPKCWYDMKGWEGRGSLVCPECGREAGSAKGLARPRRRWRLAVVALGMMVGAPMLLAATMTRAQFVARVPTGVLVAAYDVLKPPPTPQADPATMSVRQALFMELLEKRVRNQQLTPRQARQLFEISTKRGREAFLKDGSEEWAAYSMSAQCYRQMTPSDQAAVDLADVVAVKLLVPRTRWPEGAVVYGRPVTWCPIGAVVVSGLIGPDGQDVVNVSPAPPDLLSGKLWDDHLSPMGRWPSGRIRPGDVRARVHVHPRGSTSPRDPAEATELPTCEADVLIWLTITGEMRRAIKPVSIDGFWEAFADGVRIAPTGSPPRLVAAVQGCHIELGDLRALVPILASRGDPTVGLRVELRQGGAVLAVGEMWTKRASDPRYIAPRPKTEMSQVGPSYRLWMGWVDHDAVSRLVEDEPLTARFIGNPNVALRDPDATAWVVGSTEVEVDLN